jgi:hypothetical protein
VLAHRRLSLLGGQRRPELLGLGRAGTEQRSIDLDRRLSNGDVTVTTSSLSLTPQSDVGGGDGGGICCTNCNIRTGFCQECHDCVLQD